MAGGIQDLFVPIARIGFILCDIGGAVTILSALIFAMVGRCRGDSVGQWTGRLVPGVLVGGGLMLIPVIFNGMLSQPGEHATARTPAPAPTPAPTGQPAVTLPRVDNMGTLWLIPLGLVVILLAYLLVRRVAADSRRARAARAAQQEQHRQLAAAWQAIRDRHKALKRAYLHAERDWDMLFDYPSLTDVTVPETVAMLRAMRAADDTDPTLPASADQTTDLHRLPYPHAVDTFAQAWDVALAHAKQVGQDAIPAAERRTIDRIRHLLALAEDTAATPAERDVAYTQASTLIGSLRAVHVPEKTLHALETAPPPRHRSLTGGPCVHSVDNWHRPPRCVTRLSDAGGPREPDSTTDSRAPLPFP